MKNSVRNYTLPLAGYLVFTLLFLRTFDNFFFWDTVLLASKPAHFFYENNFSRYLIPDEMDSGHIPLFGAYLALLWKLLGKSLFVSHLAVLPFSLGIVRQTYQLLKKFLPEKYLPLAFFLLIADPTLLAQATLVSPDIPLMFFFLLTLNNIFSNNSLLLALGFAGMACISTRGLMLIAVLSLFDFYFNFLKKNSFSVNALLKYALKRLAILSPASIIAATYYIPHYIEKGWIGYNDSFAWAECFRPVDFKGFLRGIVIWIWRLADFGRVFLYPILFLVFIKHGRLLIKDKKFQDLLVLLLIITLFFAYPFLFFHNLKGHRYLLPMYYVIAFIFVYLLFRYVPSEKLKNISFVLVLAGLLTGHLWIYPLKISQGWDASLAHLPYYSLKDKMDEYVAEQGLPKHAIGSFFPNLAPHKYTHLTSDTSAYHAANLTKDRYVVFSNVFNVPDEVIDALKQSFHEEKRYEKCGIFIALYRRKE